MLVRPRDFEATLEDPFANDALGRQDHVKAVCSAVAQMDGPAVVALDGGWGTGKTAFLAMCMAWLQSEHEIPVVGFNAWTQGHTQLSLVDLVSALSTRPSTTADKLKKGAAALAWHLARVSTKGLIDKSVVPDAAAAENAWVDAEEKTAAFRTQLAEWAAESGPSGVVVCVDELDRCRPDYALSLLEVTRHLFDVPGVVVLLAINRNELAHSVKSVFGGCFSADRYLRRIVDRAVQLPAPRYLNIQRFLARLLVDVGLAQHLNKPASAELQQMLLTVASPPGSVRDLQQAAVLAAMAKTSMQDPAGRVDAAWLRSLIALIVLRTHTPEVYEALTAGTTDGIEAAAKLNRAWPLAPSPGQPFDAGQLEHAKRQVEAQLVMMDTDPAGRISVPADFIDRYAAAGGDETVGTTVAAEIEQWASYRSTRVPSLSAMAERIELFAQ